MKNLLATLLIIICYVTFTQNAFAAKHELKIDVYSNDKSFPRKAFSFYIDFEKEINLSSLKMKVAGICDTNANPDEVNYPVPGNDDAIRAIRLFVSKFGEASNDGMEKRESADMIPMEEEQTGQESESQEETTIVEETAVEKKEEK